MTGVVALLLLATAPLQDLPTTAEIRELLELPVEDRDARAEALDTLLADLHFALTGDPDDLPESAEAYAGLVPDLVDQRIELGPLEPDWPEDLAADLTEPLWELDFHPLVQEVFSKQLLDRSAWLRDRGDVEAALCYLEYAQEIAPPDVLPWLRLERATCRRLRSPTDAVLRELEELEASTREDDPSSPLRAHVLDELAEFYLRIGVIDRAAALLREMDRIVPADDRLSRGNLLVRRANFLLATDRNLELIEHVDDCMRPGGPLAEADGASQRSGLWIRRARAERALARAADTPSRRRELLAAARRSLREARATEIPGAERRPLQLLEAELDWLEGDHDRGRERLRRWRAEHDAASLPVSLRTWECLARARMELDPETVADELREALELNLEEWSSFPSRPGGVGFLHFDDSRELLIRYCEEWTTAHPEEAGRDEVARMVMRARACSSVARMMDAPEPSLPVVREQLLGGGRGLLSYVIAPTAACAIALDDEVHIEALDGGWSAMQEVALAFDRSLRLDDESSRRQAEEASATLGEWLLPASLRERIAGWSGLSVVGMDATSGVLIEALPLGELPLGIEMAVDHLPSEAIGLALAARARPAFARPKLLLVTEAQPPPTAVLERLAPMQEIQLDDEQRRALQAGSSEVTTWTGEQATLRQLRDFGRFDLANLLIHGVQDPTAERSAALSLSPGPDCPDGVVHCRDLEGFAAPMVVFLSACGSGRGPDRQGDASAAHWGGTLLRHGTQVVVQSRHDLALRPTAELSAAAIRDLVRHGSSGAEALRYARRSVRERWPHPRHWAPLQVMGLGQRELFVAVEARPTTPLPGSPREDAPPPRRRWIGLGGAALLLAVAVGLARRRRGA